MMLSLACTTSIALSVACLAAPRPIAIVPKPVHVKPTKGQFTLTADTVIVATADAEDVGRFLAQSLAPATGFTLDVKPDAPATARTIALTIRSAKAFEVLGNEGYALDVTPTGVKITAHEPAGLFYGVQTLRQLLPPEIFGESKVTGVEWSIPCVEIEDHPRFSWRGAMLDCARHFMPKEFVKRTIDLLALHKMNVFHWHLTDDQGWRIEIKKYPKLTETGAWRKETLRGHATEDGKGDTFDGMRHGGFYTQDDIREIVAYARDRFVTIVPEIEMPGHAQAAVASYPELGNTGAKLDVWTSWGVSENIYSTDEKTILFLQDVLGEVIGLFPSMFIHVGGDEAVKTQWKKSAAAQARMKELGLKSEDELQSWFIRRMNTFLESRGRFLIGWDEILEGGLAPGAAVMSWRGEQGGITAARAGHDVVMAPTSHTYFDYYQSKDTSREPLAIGGFLPLDVVYGYEPIPATLTADEATHVLGAQCQLWTEYVPDPKQAEYMLFPRACALAEVVWSPRESKSFADFTERLATHLRRLDALHVNHRPLKP